MGYERLGSKYFFDVDQNFLYMLTSLTELQKYFKINFLGVNILRVLYSADLIELKESYGQVGQVLLLCHVDKY